MDGNHRPVDTLQDTKYRSLVSKNPHKVADPASPYAASKSATGADASGPRYASLDKVKASNAKLIKVHHKVLQKLAQ